MAVRKKKTYRKTTLATRAKKDPVNTTVNEAKKLGVPKVVTKLAILGTVIGLATPTLARKLNVIPLMDVFTGYGGTLRSMLLNGTRARGGR